MGRVLTNAQRLSVAPYSVARGQFLPSDPVISPRISINGVANKPLDASWSSMVSQDWALFDPLDADLLWPALSTGRVLTCSESAVSELVYEVRGDRTSTRSYTAVLHDAGGASTMQTHQGSGMWIVSAFRMPASASGQLLEVDTTAGPFSVRLTGRKYDLVANGAVQGSHPRDPGDATVTCLGITVYENRITCVIREGVTTTTYTYVVSNNNNEPIYPVSMTVGGGDSAEMLVYAIAQGDNDRMVDVISLISGYLSC